MGQHATQLKVSFAVHSPIYAPVYYALNATTEDLQKRPGYYEKPFEILQSTEGDRAALASVIAPVLRHDDKSRTPKYDRQGRLRYEEADADIAICDPMVLAEHSLPLIMQGDASEISARIVAFVLKRPGLYLSVPEWLSSYLASDDFRVDSDSPIPEEYEVLRRHDPARKSQSKHSLVGRTRERSGATSQITTYENSTSACLVKWLLSGPSPIWTSQDDPQLLSVAEVTALLAERVVPDNPKVFPLLAVCDAVMQQRDDSDKTGSKGIDPVPFSFARSELIPDFPFTAVIASSDCLADHHKRRALRLLLKHLDDVVRRKPSERLSALNNQVLYKSFKDASPSNPEGKDILYFINRFFAVKGHTNSYGGEMVVVPDSVSPDPALAWVEKGWCFSWHDLWKLSRLSSTVDPISALRSISVMHLSRRNYWRPATLSRRTLLWSTRQTDAKSNTLWIGLAVSLAIFLLMSSLALVPQFGSLLPETSWLSRTINTVWHPDEGTIAAAVFQSAKDLLARDAFIVAGALLFVAVVLQPAFLFVKDYQRSRAGIRMTLVPLYIFLISPCREAKHGLARLRQHVVTNLSEPRNTRRSKDGREA